MIKLGFPDSSEAPLCYLKNVLIGHRKALKGQHIRRAYTLPAGHPIRNLFCQAVVREYMMNPSKASKSFDDMANHSADDDDDDDDLTPAQTQAYRFGFPYKHLLERIQDFKLDLYQVQDKVLKEGFIEKTVKERRKRTPEVRQKYYLDPLDNDRALWFTL